MKGESDDVLLGGFDPEGKTLALGADIDRSLFRI